MAFPWDVTHKGLNRLGGSGESRFPSVKSFYPRSCQWWHLELVAEHLPEFLLSSKVRPMRASGLHQPLARPLRSAVGTHTGFGAPARTAFWLSGLGEGT